MEQKESALRQELEELQGRLSDPGIFSTKEYPKLAKRQQTLERTLSLFETVRKLRKDISEAETLAESDDELGELAKQELEPLTKQLTSAEQDLDELLTPKDPNDERDVVVEIRAAAGGDEASLFAADLYRMYVRWAERHNYKVQLIERNYLRSTWHRYLQAAQV